MFFYGTNDIAEWGGAAHLAAGKLSGLIESVKIAVMLSMVFNLDPAGHAAMA